jgi:transposase InsO family protein
MKTTHLVCSALFALSLHAHAADKVKIGFVSTLSGPLSALGIDIRDGFRLALKETGNKIGGLPAEVVEGDDQASPDVGKQIADRLLKRDKVDFMTWVADITYVPTSEGWLYLAAVMDLAGRRIVGRSMSETIDATLVCTALKSAWWLRKPAKGLLVHTDCGSQYAGGRYRALAAELGITMSMSRRTNAWDNAPMESFFNTLKVERIHQVRYDTRAQARLDIVD